MLAYQQRIRRKENIQCVWSYDALFWSRENCSILRRRNKLIKSRTDHKRTVKWQPVWFGNLQLKLFLPLFKGCKVSTLVKCNAFSPFGKLCQFEFKILTKLFCSMSFDAWTSQQPIPVSPLGLDLRCGALQCICKRWFVCKNTFCQSVPSNMHLLFASLFSISGGARVWTGSNIQVTIFQKTASHHLFYNFFICFYLFFICFICFYSLYLFICLHVN